MIRLRRRRLTVVPTAFPAVPPIPALSRRPTVLGLTMNGVSPRLEIHGLGLIANHAYSAPYEDLRLKRP